MNISYIVPCYNEEKNIKEVYSHIINANKSSGIFDFEIILVNDFSSDNT